MPERLRDRIVAAVDGLARSRGWSATTMSDVAAAAGVSRQSVYNEFRSRSALVEAYAIREISGLLDEVEAAVRAHAHDAHQALRSAFELFLKLASDEPVVRVIVAGSDDELIRLLTTVGQTLATDRVGGLIAEVWPQVGARDAYLLASSLVRLAISHALVPSEDPADVAAGVSRLLASFVDELLASATDPAAGSGGRPAG